MSFLCCSEHSKGSSQHPDVKHAGRLYPGVSSALLASITQVEGSAGLKRQITLREPGWCSGFGVGLRLEDLDSNPHTVIMSSGADVTSHALSLCHIPSPRLVFT